jgi:hypothetical protein
MNMSLGLNIWVFNLCRRIQLNQFYHNLSSKDRVIGGILPPITL